ncbi:MULTISPECIES: ABC transporter ATP-binding protein [Ramlibacter]|uniref:ATP-binding cassette domain-containing protein n=1 Tax=Ramlibacter pinisoli TaxID=2682844 RepID=A0A6N8ITN9_9BURK|nr:MULTISPECIES: ABC transporter ATP-binding protein [Ramlibacter]MBA2965107.1 ABC transporter ATP-binding protein [Ramlibacter sp. CGMCC 1.13660]MVQ30072.1 ATP-binding cassette domain-containing protein [Ramlibacter pinisoli]
MLDIQDVQAAYGAAPALWGVSLRVDAGELVCVVGPNGAGKSTLINVIAGLHRARAGRIMVDGQDVTQLAPHRFCGRGVAIVPEGRRLFTGMTVQENLELGSFLPGPKAARARTLEQVLALFPALRQKLGQPAGSLSGGQQQMVAIGRALMSQPKLLLLDEPSLGLAPAVVLDMFEAIRSINAGGTSVLLVEQNVAMAMELARRAYVMEEGRIVAEGIASELMHRPEIRKAYLGLETH